MKKGFTLIELLIVVAIIAILAAIAVPNFLEAQVRSKISRAKADLRTIAVAVESYAVDYNGPPIGYYEINRSTLPAFAPLKADRKLRNPWSYSTMTSPVAYITTAPLDPFIEVGMYDGNNNLVTDPEYRYFHYQSSPGNMSRTGTKDMGATYKTASGMGVKWVASSVGPSRRWKPESWSGSRSVIGVPGPMYSTSNRLMYPGLIYDSTNGTRSFGYMIHSNKGVAGS